MAAKNTLDMTKGSVTKQLLLFALPVLLGNLLQQFYNVADRVVVGRFAENGALGLAAIGATSSATNLILGLFNGMGVGVNVICANHIGARNEKGLRKCMHTAVLVALLCGVAVALIGIVSAGGILRLLATPEDVHSMSTLYMQIYFAGTPVSLLYNFGAGILRAHGDTKRPMYILILSGLANVILNVVFVVVFKLGVAGVAIATVASQVLSAAMVLKILFDPRDKYKLRLKEMKIHSDQLTTIVRVGIPTGFGSMVFGISNVIIQSSINSFNSAAVIAGRTIATDLNGLYYQITAALFAACVSFSGQCYGAGEYKRIDSLAKQANILSLAGYLICAIVSTVFSKQIVGLFNSDPEVIRIGVLVLLISCWGDLLYSPTEIFIGCMRGMRYGMLPTVMNLIGVCVPRLLWVWVIFPMNRTVFWLMLCYPISWATSSLIQGITYVTARRKMDRKEEKI